MKHVNRKRRRANAARRKQAAAKQAPLLKDTQAWRAMERAGAKAATYPAPPSYADIPPTTGRKPRAGGLTLFPEAALAAMLRLVRRSGK